MEGLLTSFYFDAGKDIASLAEGLNSGDRAATLLDIKKRGVVFTQQPPSASSPEEVAYQIAISRGGRTVYFHANIHTGQLTRLERTGAGDGAQIVMRENIVQITSPASVPKGTFILCHPPVPFVRLTFQSVLNTPMFLTGPP